VRVITWPEPTLVTIIASISGIRTRPEAVADAPSTSCT
jgi:hypothetical protein